LMFGEYDRSALKSKLSRQTMKHLAQCICDVVQPHEYVLVIDSVDRIPPRAVDVLELFKDHFTIITSAREVALNKTSFLWNFETHKIEALTRPMSLELINKLSYDMEIEDYEQYKNYIWNKSDGNPRVIFEMCDRFRKEVIVSKDTVRSIDHYGSLKEIDMSIFILIALGCMAIFRYVGKETGNTSLTFIGGCAMIILILSRYFFGFTKQKVLK
jgi:integrase/recombinase XerD